MLQSITHNGFSYNFTYDQFGKRTGVKVGSQTLNSDEYNENGTLKKSTYGNGDNVESVYDELDQVVAKKYNGTVKYEWEYGSNGQVSKYIDRVNNTSYRYEYDLAGRVQRIYGSDGFKLRNIYDAKGNVYNTLYSFDNNNYIKAFSNWLIQAATVRIAGLNLIMLQVCLGLLISNI